jgi:hypothetical protein
MKMWKKKLLKFLIVFILLLAGYVYFVSHFHYSEGSRTGYLFRVIKVGYVFKTNEGELYLGGASAGNASLVNNQWEFSVPDPEMGLLDSLEKYQGNVVKVTYYKVIQNMPWQGNTKYFASKVEFVREK